MGEGELIFDDDPVDVIMDSERNDRLNDILHGMLFWLEGHVRSHGGSCSMFGDINEQAT